MISFIAYYNKKLLTIASLVISYNQCIKIDSKSTYNFQVSEKNINFVRQIFKFGVKLGVKLKILGRLD